jgi:hypothetical protein
MDKAREPWSPPAKDQEERSMDRALNAFYSNAVVYMVAVAALGALCAYIGQTTITAFLFMVLGMMMVLWDAHNDPHVPPAPSLT